MRAIMIVVQNQLSGDHVAGIALYAVVISALNKA
jgi:hypothetical protein